MKNDASEVDMEYSTLTFDGWNWKMRRSIPRLRVNYNHEEVLYIAGLVILPLSVFSYVVGNPPT